MLSVNLDKRFDGYGAGSPQDVNFYVSLSRPYYQPVSVSYSTVDHTAIAGINYEATSGVLTFAPGETVKMFSVRLKDNKAMSTNSYFTVVLSNPVNCVLGKYRDCNLLIMDSRSITSKTISIDDFGAIGDGVTDNLRNIQDSIDFMASRFNGGTVVIPHKTYMTGFLNLRNNTYLYGEGGTLKLYNSYTDRAETGLITISAHDTGILGDLTLDGNRYNRDTDFWYYNTETGVMVMGHGAYNITLSNIAANNFTMDGFYFGYYTNAPRNVTAGVLTSSNCGRNGVSITALTDSTFDTMILHDMNSRSDQSLMGLDIEPNLITDVIGNITINNVVAYNNPRAGASFLYFVGDGVKRIDVTIKNMAIYNNGFNSGNGIFMRGISGLNIENAEIYNNWGNGVYVSNDVQDVRFKGKIHDNNDNGFDISPTSQHFQTRDIVIADSEIYNNAKGDSGRIYGSYGIRMGTDDPVNFPVSNIIINRVKLYDNQQTPTQRYGFSGDVGVRNVGVFAYISGNSYKYRGTNGYFTILYSPPEIIAPSGTVTGPEGMTVSCPISFTNYWVDPIPVTVTTVNGTAQSDVNYVPVSNVLTLESYGYRNVNGMMVFDGNKTVTQEIQLLLKGISNNRELYLNIDCPQSKNSIYRASIEIQPTKWVQIDSDQSGTPIDIQADATAMPQATSVPAFAMMIAPYPTPTAATEGIMVYLSSMWTSVIGTFIIGVAAGASILFTVGKFL